MHAMVRGGVGLWAATAASPSVLLVPRTVRGSSKAPTVGFKALLHKAPGSTVCSGSECDQDLWGCWGCMEFRLLVSGFPICPRVLTACFVSSASCETSWVCFTDQATDLHRRGGAASWKDRGRRDSADQLRSSRAAPPLVLKAESSSNPAPCQGSILSNVSCELKQPPFLLWPYYVCRSTPNPSDHETGVRRMG